MATPLQSLHARSRTRGLVRSAVALAASSAAVLAVLPTTAGHADPAPSLAEVSHRVDVLDGQVDVAVEEYANSKLALASASRKAAVAQARVTVAEGRLDAVRQSISAMASAAYRTGGTDQLVSLFSTATPQTFLDRASSLDRISRGQADQLVAVAAARHDLDAARATANREVAVQTAAQDAMAQQQRRIEAALAQEKALLASLQAQERARLEAQRAQALAAARRAALAERASRQRAAAASHVADTGGGGGTYTGPASGRAGVAVSEAYRKLGSPYQWGASGPSRFDCSGLTSWVWAKAGVSLSHSSQAQYGEGQHVSRADIQPGDLTFYGSPIHHVGIYIGGGQMISAPHTGDVVKIQSAFRSDYVGAVRP